MSRTNLAIALAALSCAGQAVAQTSNCMAMGGGMVHCDNMGSNGSMSSTNCTGTGPTTATCQTTNLSDGTSSGGDDQTGAMVLRGIGSFIGWVNDGAFRRHLKQKLAAGDCQGAANYAFSKGKADLGVAISQSCSTYAAKSPPSIATPSSPSALAAQMQQAAATLKTPMALNDTTTLVLVEPQPRQLLLLARVNTSLPAVSDQDKAKAAQTMCSYAPFRPVMASGAAVRLVYVGEAGSAIGAVAVNQQNCGFQ